MSQSPDEQIAPPPQPAARKRLFSSALGETSLVLCGIFLALSWALGFIVKSVESKQGAELADGRILSFAATALCVAVGLAAVVYGLLAVCGFGKAWAKNDRLQGGIGAAIGFVLTAGLVALQFVVGGSLRLGMVEKSAPWPFLHEPTGFVLNQPAEYWVVNVGDDAKKFDPHAIAAAAAPTKGTEFPNVLVVLESEVPDIDMANLDLQGVAQAIAEANVLKNKTIERVETAEIASVPAAISVISGEAERGEIRQFYATLFRGETCLQLIFVTEKSDATGNEAFDTVLRAVEFRRVTPAR